MPSTPTIDVDGIAASTVTIVADPTTGAPDEPDWLDEREQRAWWALLEVGSGLMELISRELRVAGDLVLEDYEVLHLLSQADDRRLRIGDLSDLMLASRTRLSQRVDRLVARGWVEREACTEDRRAVWVVLTDEGFRFLADLAPEHLGHVRRHVFDHLTPTDVDRLGTSLSKIAEHLHDERRRSR